MALTPSTMLPLGTPAPDFALDDPSGVVHRLADAVDAPVLVVAQGQRPDGSAVNGWAAYFIKGSQVVQVVMYASAIEPVAAEIYFASLKFD